jgi:ribosome biogenesis GTPase
MDRRAAIPLGRSPFSAVDLERQGMSSKKRKQKGKKAYRASFKKNRSDRTRVTDWTRKFEEHQFADDDPVLQERLSGKGDLTRKRTVVGSIVQHDDEVEGQGEQIVPEVDLKQCRAGKVLRVHGLNSYVESRPDGTVYRCTTRRLLKTLATDQRHVVVAGDEVLFRPSRNVDSPEGIIERVQPRTGSLSRTSRRRRHILVTNVDQVIILTSAAQPRLKPNLIDRILLTSERAGIRPIICINKIDLYDPADLQPLVGTYRRMGYPVFLTSVTEAIGVSALREVLAGRQTVVAGQSGVGKSSLLNAIEPELQLRVGRVSRESEKGRHTTTAAELIKLSFGGYVVDTPGIRQFALWDIIPEEVVGFYRDLRPFENHCRFPDCTHEHEADCAVKNAVADGMIDARRYESYLGVRAGDSI